MNLAKPTLLLIILTILCTRSTIAQVSGGQSGYDATLEAIEPKDKKASVGLAGEDPSQIGRYILAANGGLVTRAYRLTDRLSRLYGLSLESVSSGPFPQTEANPDS